MGEGGGQAAESQVDEGSFDSVCPRSQPLTSRRAQAPRRRLFPRHTRVTTLVAPRASTAESTSCVTGDTETGLHFTGLK